MIEDAEIQALLTTATHARAAVLAVETLEKNLRCGNPRAEVQAAASILRLSNAFTEKQLLQRLEVLEREARGARTFRPSLC